MSGEQPIDIPMKLEPTVAEEIMVKLTVKEDPHLGLEGQGGQSPALYPIQR